MRLSFILLIFLSFTIALPTMAQNDVCGKLNKKVEKTYEEALMNYGQAMALVANPDRADYYFKQSNMLLKEVIETAPDYAPAYYYLGCINLFKKENSLTFAEKYLLKTVELCPEGMHDSYFQLGKLYFGMNQMGLASQNLKKFLDKPDQIEDDSLMVEAKTLYKWASTAETLMKNPVLFNPKLVPGISSKFDEYLVFITPDNEKAFYTRRTEERDSHSAWASDLKYKEKFFVSNRNPINGKALSEIPFDNGAPMPLPFNVDQNEGGATVTIDNSELIYTVCRYKDAKDPNSYFNCDLFYSKYEFGGWSDIVPLDNVNSPDNWETQPSISSDGKTLFFISDRPGGRGGYDVYTSTRDESGTWSIPMNMGAQVNSKGNEKSPFIHTDSQTLYFSSSGRPGMGGYDIYYTRKSDKGEWQEPTNIGYPINSQFDDVGFFVSTDGKYGYFGSNKYESGAGGWDFYSFELYEEARPEKVLFIKGTVKNENDSQPLQAKVEIKNMETKEIKQIPVDLETGNYVAAMRFSSDYVLTVKQPDFVYESTYISMDDTTFDEPANVDVDLQPVELGKAYRMKDIYYESNSAELTPDSKKVLDEFIEFLTENPRIKVSIQGHTDNLGSDASNLQLSNNRAKSVYEYLILKGISSSRLSYKGFGESVPVSENDTEVGRALNRRTEFLVTGM